QPHLHDGDEHEHDQRQHERELDGGLPAVGPPAGAGGPGGGHSPFMSFLTTPSNRPVKLPVLPTQAMMPRAMPPATRITSPYSVVACPRSSVAGRAAPTARVARRRPQTSAARAARTQVRNNMVDLRGRGGRDRARRAALLRG